METLDSNRSENWLLFEELNVYKVKGTMSMPLINTSHLQHKTPHLTNTYHSDSLKTVPYKVIEQHHPARNRPRAQDQSCDHVSNQ